MSEQHSWWIFRVLNQFLTRWFLRRNQFFRKLNSWRLCCRREGYGGSEIIVISWGFISFIYDIIIGKLYWKTLTQYFSIWLMLSIWLGKELFRLIRFSFWIKVFMFNSSCVNKGSATNLANRGLFCDTKIIHIRDIT